jgi:hypothetical protein
VLSKSDLSFFYDCKKVAYIFCAVLVWDPKLNARNFAFIDHTWFHDTRVKRTKAQQPSRKHYISAKSLEELPIDPCHVAVVIAMAQDVYRKRGDAFPHAKVL